MKRNASLVFIFITLLLDVIGIGIIIPVFPKLITQLINGDLSEAAQYGGWLMFAYSIMQFIFSPILGGLSDMYGRRPVILLSLLGFGLDYFLLGFSPTITWLFVGRFLAGITGASFTAAGAYIADISSPEKRAANFGLIGAAFGLGFIIGPALGGGLATLGTWLVNTYPDTHFLGYDINFWGSRLPFFVSGVLTLINCLYGYFILPESLSPENRRQFDWKRANPIGSLAQLKRYPTIFGLVVPLVLLYIAGYASQSTWTYYTMYKFGWKEGMVAASLSFVGLMAAIVQGGLTRKLIPLWGERKTVFIGLMLYTIGFVLYAIAWEGWLIIAFTAVAALGGISLPALQGIMSNQVPANEQGELRGALTSLMSLTSIIGPLMMSYLFAYFTSKDAIFQLPAAPFWAAALLAICSFFWVKMVLKTPKENI